MLNLTVGLTKNPRFEPLVDGTIRPQNIRLEFVVTSPPELFYRNLKYNEFDVFEMSISEYIMTKERGDGIQWQWSGLPVFPLDPLTSLLAHHCPDWVFPAGLFLWNG